MYFFIDKCHVNEKVHSKVGYEQLSRSETKTIENHEVSLCWFIIKGPQGKKGRKKKTKDSPWLYLLSSRIQHPIQRTLVYDQPPHENTEQKKLKQKKGTSFLPNIIDINKQSTLQRVLFILGVVSNSKRQTQNQYGNQKLQDLNHKLGCLIWVILRLL